MKATHFPNNIITFRQCFVVLRMAPRRKSFERRQSISVIRRNGSVAAARRESFAVSTARSTSRPSLGSVVVNEVSAPAQPLPLPRPRQLGHCTSTAWLASFDHLRMNASAGAHSTEREESIETPLLNKESEQAAARVPAHAHPTETGTLARPHCRACFRTRAGAI